MCVHPSKFVSRNISVSYVFRLPVRMLFRRNRPRRVQLQRTRPLPSLPTFPDPADAIPDIECRNTLDFFSAMKEPSTTHVRNPPSPSHLFQDQRTNRKPLRSHVFKQYKPYIQTFRLVNGVVLRFSRASTRQPRTAKLRSQRTVGTSQNHWSGQQHGTIIIAQKTPRKGGRSHCAPPFKRAFELPRQSLVVMKIVQERFTCP